jgi:hypothetical protein
MSTGDISIAGNGDGIGASSFLGAANVTSSGNISIAGFGAGIEASSFLGPVNLTSSGNISVAGSGGVGIDASSFLEAVNVTSSGNISVTGTNSSGINVFGAVANVTSSGNVTASGDGGSGIVIGSFNGDIGVNITGGTIAGGSGGGAGVVLLGGGNNTLTNFGTITTTSGLAGTAILASPLIGGFLPFSIVTFIGNNTVNNVGTIIGNVDLGPGRNTFNNLQGGTFNSGASVNLGAGNTLNNTGNLSPGGSGVFQTTALTGNLM